MCGPEFTHSSPAAGSVVKGTAGRVKGHLVRFSYIRASTLASANCFPSTAFRIVNPLITLTTVLAFKPLSYRQVPNGPNFRVAPFAC